MDIYISTDSNEVKQILEKRELQWNEFVNNYNFSSDKIKLNGKCHTITNLPMIDGEEIKNKYKLYFSPMSVINLPLKNSNNLIKKLAREGLYVSIINNGKVENHFPTKYDGYQGRKFN